MTRSWAGWWCTLAACIVRRSLFVVWCCCLSVEHHNVHVIVFVTLNPPSACSPGQTHWHRLLVLSQRWEWPPHGVRLLIGFHICYNNFADGVILYLGLCVLLLLLPVYLYNVSLVSLITAHNTPLIREPVVRTCTNTYNSAWIPMAIRQLGNCLNTAALFFFYPTGNSIMFPAYKTLDTIKDKRDLRQLQYWVQCGGRIAGLGWF